MDITDEIILAVSLVFVLFFCEICYDKKESQKKET